MLGRDQARLDLSWGTACFFVLALPVSAHFYLIHIHLSSPYSWDVMHSSTYLCVPQQNQLLLLSQLIRIRTGMVRKTSWKLEILQRLSKKENPITFIMLCHRGQIWITHPSISGKLQQHGGVGLGLELQQWFLWAFQVFSDPFMLLACIECNTESNSLYFPEANCLKEKWIQDWHQREWF